MVSSATIRQGYEGELEALLCGLTRTAGQFALYIAFGPSEVAEPIARELKEQGAAIVVRFCLEGASLLDQVAAAKRDGKPLIVLGLDAIRAPEERHRLWRGLNWSRPRWPRKVGFPVVLWLCDSAVREIGREAPDFFDWVSGIYEFPMRPAASDPETDLCATRDAKVSERTDTLRRRVDELTSALDSLAAEEGTILRRLRMIRLVERSKAYQKLADLPAAMSDADSALTIAQELVSRYPGDPRYERDLRVVENLLTQWQAGG